MLVSKDETQEGRKAGIKSSGAHLSIRFLASCFPAFLT